DVDVNSPAPKGGHQPLPPGAYPDALIPVRDPDTGALLDGPLKASDATVKAEENQPYWIDVQVPRDATPGTYTGTWTVTSDRAPMRGQVTLTVDDFTLP